ncbi:MAG: ATP-binding cassette domain-containing protein, partial [Candidatus Thorarchaeota archaeon]
MITDDIVIKTEGLTKSFDGHLAVEDLTLQVERGEVFAFLGPNGAGKTTTVRLLAALIAPTSG